MDSKIIVVVSAHDLPAKRLSYGTAGFRDKHHLPLHSIFVRMGILACLRSLSLGCKCVGVMITASHNPEDDNGLKIVDADGGMLAQSWEPYAELLANVEIAGFMDAVQQICSKENIPLTSATNVPVVVIGRDTRWHSAQLSDCVQQGIAAMNGVCHQLGEVITPQLHYVVHQLNSRSVFPALTVDTSGCLQHYYQSMCSGYRTLKATGAVETDKNINSIIVDASCGVGSIVLDAFNETMQSASTAASDPLKLTVEVRNGHGSGKVNEGCGAELVQKSQVPPKGVSAAGDAGKLMCSFDGDGDRVVFHGYLPDGSWILLDGDKIAALITTFLHGELVAAGLDSQYSLGIVQTAYANGASTAFLARQGVHTCVAKTGVKFVHHRALEFDVGVYFEANGHGTVLFSEAVSRAIRRGGVDDGEQQQQVGEGAEESRRALAYRRLQASLLLINQTVGDALSDMLLCLAALQILGMDMRGWHQMYSDLPSSQVKVGVPDKSKVACSEDETRVLAPAAMQADLDAAMAAVMNGRCFVRPSGTEDVVRIYAEAATQDEANKLCSLTRQAIEKHLY